MSALAKSTSAVGYQCWSRHVILITIKVITLIIYPMNSFNQIWEKLLVLVMNGENQGHVWMEVIVVLIFYCICIQAAWL